MGPRAPSRTDDHGAVEERSCRLMTTRTCRSWRSFVSEWPEDEFTGGIDVGSRTLTGRRSPISHRRCRELEQRLREQAERNAQLDTEVRYLLQELGHPQRIYRPAPKPSSTRLMPAAGEFAAYRARISYRIVDRLATWVHRLPWLYRPLKRLGANCRRQR